MAQNTNYRNRPGVIVIGGHVQGLGLVRIFGKNGLSVIVLDKTKINLARHSIYCKKFIKYKKDKLLNELIALGAKGEYANWLLMPTGDGDVEVLSKNKIELSKYFKVSSESFDVLGNFYNKRNTYKLVSDLNIPFPDTWMVDSWEELNNINLPFPCIIKPAVMHTFYAQSKKKVFVCNNVKELEQNYSKALKLIPKEEIIIQDIIPGNSENQYSVCFMFDGKKPLVSLTARRARQHPLDFGNATTYAETVDVKDILKEAELILEKVNYRGLCEVEFKYDLRDKKFKFLEVNPRTWKWHSLADKSDSPLLMSLYHNLYHLEPIIKNSQKSAAFRHLITDIPTVLRMKFKGQKIGRTSENIKYAVWDKTDLKPAFFELLYLVNLIFTR